jgi:GNAT superfamily N-acetyltransferase
MTAEVDHMNNMRRRTKMDIVKANIQDLPIVVNMKMEMFREVGSISLLQENVEDKIHDAYLSLYREDKCCHYIAFEDGKAVACGGAVIKEDVPFCFFKTPYYGYIIDVYCIPEKRRNGYASQIMKDLTEWLGDKGVHCIKLKPSEEGRLMYKKMEFYDSGEMEKWI